MPKSKRLFTVDRGQNVPSIINGAHCFELTEIQSAVWEMMHELGSKVSTPNGTILPIDETLAFLPAPITWLEWFDNNAFGGGSRIGILLEQAGDFALGTVCASSHKYFCTASQIILPLRNHDSDVPDAKFFAGQIKVPPSENVSEDRRATCVRLTAFAFIALAFINTPRIIGRRQHMPNVGLERRIAKSLGMVGRFPLHAWTEIKLEVGPTHDAMDDPSREAHLTGKKALHFCRQHLRIRMGRLELVRAHWRGDPSLGIKRSRYNVTMPSAPRNPKIDANQNGT